MTYEQALEALYRLGQELPATPSHKFDLTHMRVMLEALGHPERRFPSVLIAGTNGKGSTAATLASILHAAGYKTGLYTSPHLIRINERIRVGGQPVADDEFACIYSHIESTVQSLLADKALPWHPSFFEVLTVTAFEAFARSSVQVAVLEVGMGGRLDATNVVDPIIAVITDISLDHQKFLGNTLPEIAAEKAGIIKPGGTVVTLPQHPAANDVIGNAILEQQAVAVSAVKHMPPLAPGVEAPTIAPSRNRYPLEVMGEQILVDSPLIGRHQTRNLALAISTAEELQRFGLPLSPRDIETGIRETQWPGRFQVVPPSEATSGQETIMDVAHNPDGAWALRAALSEHVADRAFTLVFGAMRDKAYAEMAQILFPAADRVVVTHANSPRAANTDEIAAAASATGADIMQEGTVAAAMRRAREITPANGIVVVTGSIYIVGEAMRELGLRV